MKNDRKRRRYSIYFIMIGILFLSNTAYIKFDQHNKRVIYSKIQAQLKEIRSEKQKSPYFRETNKTVYRERVAAVKTLSEEFKARYLEKIHFLPMMICLVGCITGALYAYAGNQLLKTKEGAGQLLQIAAAAWLVYILFYTWNAYKEISFLDVASVYFMELSTSTHPMLEKFSRPALIRGYFSFISGRLSLFLTTGFFVYMLPIICFFQAERKEQQDAKRPI